MSKNITLKEIAQVLGVSVSTVSKSLHNSSEISVTTRSRVNKLAEKLNYRPNYIAQSLKSKSTKTIGVVIPDILNYFFVKALSGIEKADKEKGYRIVTCISNDSFNSEVEHIYNLANGSVDGLILSLATETERLNNYDHILNVINKSTPVVMFDRVANNLKCVKITSDNYNGAYKATELLVNKGCQNVALFLTNLELSVVKDRKKGFIDCLEFYGILNKELIFNIKNPEEQELIRDILYNNQIDAVFSVDELLAIKVIKEAKKMDIMIPETMKVIGFSDGDLSKEFTPSLTTVDLHPEKIGALAINSLIERLDSNIKKHHSEEVQSTLIIRDSV